MRQSKTVYYWNAATKELSGEDEAWESPREPGVFHLSSDSTLEPPPEKIEGFARVRRNDAWVQVEHHRGKSVYDKTTGAERKVKDEELGVPDGFTLAKPPNDYSKWDTRTGTWVEDPDKKAAHDEEVAATEERNAAIERLKQSDTELAQDVLAALGIR